MAKRKRHSNRSYNKTARVTSRQRYQSRLVRRRSVSLSPLFMYEDRRQFHPAGPIHRPVSAFVRSATIKHVPFVSPVNKAVGFMRAIPTFNDPQKVFVCIRRKARREVLHAFFGRLGGAVGKARRRSTSDVRC